MLLLAADLDDGRADGPRKRDLVLTVRWILVHFTGSAAGRPAPSTHELGIQPDAYAPKLDVDFTPLREQDLTAGLGQAA